MVCFCKNTHVQVLGRDLSEAIWLTLPNKSKMQHKEKCLCCYDLPPCTLVSGPLLNSGHQGKRFKEDTQGYTNTKLHSDEKRWKERADFCVTESVEHKSFQAFVYVGAVFHSSTPFNKTLLYEFTPICTIRTYYPFLWHVNHADLCTIWVNVSDLLIYTDAWSFWKSREKKKKKSNAIKSCFFWSLCRVGFGCSLLCFRAAVIIGRIRKTISVECLSGREST